MNEGRREAEIRHDLQRGRLLRGVMGGVEPASGMATLLPAQQRVMQHRIEAGRRDIFVGTDIFARIEPRIYARAPTEAMVEIMFQRIGPRRLGGAGRVMHWVEQRRFGQDRAAQAAQAILRRQLGIGDAGPVAGIGGQQPDHRSGLPPRDDIRLAEPCGKHRRRRSGRVCG